MSAPLTQTAPAAKPVASQPLHPRHSHLDTLIRAGIVTHLVAVDETLDPVFALGRMRDLEEVGFAAAFRDGLIAIGCPDGLPDELKTVAIRAFPVGPPPVRPAATPPDTVPPRIDRLAAQVETLLAEVRPAATITATLAERMDRLEDAASPRALQKAMAPLIDQVGALHHRLDLAEDTAEPDPIAALAERFTRLESRLAAGPDGISPLLHAVEALGERLDTPVEPHHRLMQELLVLRKKLDGLKMSAPDNAAQELKFDKFATVLSMIVKRAETAATQIGETVEKLREVPAGETDLQPLLDRLDAITAPDLAAVTAQIDALRHDLTRQAIPSDDTEQRQRFAALDAALDRVAHRVDAAVGPAAERERRQEEILTILADLRRDIAARADVAPQLATLAQRIEKLSTEGAALPDQIERLHKEVADWASQPPPAPDLSAIEEALDRLATRPLPVVDLGPLESGLAALTARADTAPLVEGFQAELAQIARHVAALAEQPDTQDAIIQALREDVAALLARPDALGELVAQKQGFARLSSALSAAVARLDSLATRLRGEDAEIMEEIRALPALLRQTVEQTANLAPLHAALESLRDGLAQLPEKADFEPLEKAVATLADRADPEAALSAQKHALARLGSGITLLIDRLEQVVSDPGVTEAVSAEGQRLAGTLAQMERRLSVMAQDHGEHLDALARQVERAVLGKAEGPARPGPFDRVRAEFTEITGGGTTPDEEDAPVQAAE